jgi:hypothetical protein
MSEYQYYEFQAIDRPLTDKEQAAISQLSSRVKLTSHRAIFVYNYGDFHGKPEEIVTQYFDIMFYIANWGSWQLIFRFPKALVDPDWFQPYALPHVLTITQTPQYVVLNIEIYEEDWDGGWLEGEGWLPRLLPLRDDLLRGDLRLLYLVWLRMAPLLENCELEEDPFEPPLPPNLDRLSSSLQAFIELVELDPDLVTAAAQTSPQEPASDEQPLENWLSALSEDEKQEFLLKLVRREPHVDLQLINRLKELAGTNRTTPQSNPSHRRLSELEELADKIGKEREYKERKEARKARIKELEKLEKKEDKLWERVMDLIALKQGKPYDEAAALLVDLRDLAEYRGRSPEFWQRLEKLKSDYSNRPALLQRFNSIGK